MNARNQHLKIITIGVCLATFVCRHELAKAEGTSGSDQFRKLAYEQLPAGAWKKFQVGASDQTLNLRYGKSYYAAIALPSLSGTVELRTQRPPFGYKGILPCVTLLDAEYRITRSAGYKEASAPPLGAFRPMESSLLEMKLQKKATDRYMLVHTDEKVVGKEVHYELGNRGSTTIVTGSYFYSAPNRTSMEISSTAKGGVRVKFYPTQ